MARQCDKCERKPAVGMRRSHSNIASKRRMMINLQRRKVDGVRMTVCTSCIKTLAKQKVY